MQIFFLLFLHVYVRDPFIKATNGFILFYFIFYFLFYYVYWLIDWLIEVFLKFEFGMFIKQKTSNINN